MRRSTCVVVGEVVGLFVVLLVVLAGCAVVVGGVARSCVGESVSGCDVSAPICTGRFAFWVRPVYAVPLESSSVVDRPDNVGSDDAFCVDVRDVDVFR